MFVSNMGCKYLHPVRSSTKILAFYEIQYGCRSASWIRWWKSCDHPRKTIHDGCSAWKFRHGRNSSVEVISVWISCSRLKVLFMGPKFQFGGLAPKNLLGRERYSLKGAFLGEMTNFEPSLVHSLLCTYQSTTKYSGPCTLMLQQLCYSQRLIKALPTACVKSLIEYIRTVATTVPVYSRRCI